MHESLFSFLTLLPLHRAIAIVRLELNPPKKPEGSGGDEVKGPTGAKRAELMKKIETMQKKFNEIIDVLIDQVLWGGDKELGLIDQQLGAIEDVASSRFARVVSVGIHKSMQKGKSLEKLSENSRYLCPSAVFFP